MTINCLFTKRLGILNPPDEVGLLHSNYDKALHVLGTFTSMAFLAPLIGGWTAGIVTVILQLSKTVLNYRGDRHYTPTGDWMSNGGGFILYTLYAHYLL